jgi:hypothetical protein
MTSFEKLLILFLVCPVRLWQLLFSNHPHRQTMCACHQMNHLGRITTINNHISKISIKSNSLTRFTLKTIFY